MQQPPSPDPDALRYSTYWEPVLAAAAQRLLTRIDAEPRTYLDIGAGTGSLMSAAAARWPEAHMIGLDASAAMLSVARARLAGERSDDLHGQCQWLVADAAGVPLPDASVDVVTSSFLLQLVPDRPAALAEMCRLLRPGGILGVVTWIADESVLAADDAFAASAAELGLVAQRDGLEPGDAADYGSLVQATDELDAAGFTDIDVRSDELRFTWSRRGYLEFKEHYDEREIFESLDAAARVGLREAFLARLARLPDEALTLAAPLVSVVARRP
jgi:ubiquinone/menaquinone biosynthesis C-methylase UbiE